MTNDGQRQHNERRSHETCRYQAVQGIGSSPEKVQPPPQRLAIGEMVAQFGLLQT